MRKCIFLSTEGEPTCDQPSGTWCKASKTVLLAVEKTQNRLKQSAANIMVALCFQYCVEGVAEKRNVGEASLVCIF